MSWRKALSWLLTVAIILPILTACKEDGKDPEVTQILKSLSKDEAVHENTRIRAKALLETQALAHETIKKFPKLRALPKDGAKFTKKKVENLHAINSALTDKVLLEQDKALKDLVDSIKVLSKVKYSENLSPALTAEAESLVFLNLLSVRAAAQAAARKILYLMTKFDKPYFDELPENEIMKQRLLVDYTSALAIAAVSANDLRSTLKNLSELRAEGVIAKELEANITKLVATRGMKEHEERSHVNQFMQESTTEKAQNALAEAKQKYHESLKGKSFLFDPALPDHPLVHVLVIVGNLSWGLVNTLVGLGFVITAAIVAPITQVAGATVRAFGYEPLFMEMRMPRLRIAESNMQIYADVCGLGFIPSKMSAGLFELDFCTDYSFASDHEAGHAKQSALLGPLYFPAAILSYILNMGHGGFIEDWADEWATT